jgi:hypothetical protein
MRKTHFFPCVTFGLVDEGLIIGMPRASQMLPPTMLRELATSPKMATTRSRVMSFWTAAAASSVLPASSSVMTTIFLPNTPP